VNQRKYPESHVPASLSFSTLGRPQFTIRVDTDLLSARDKVELFRALMDDLGISERFHAEPDAVAEASKIIVEQWGRAWEGKL